MKHQVVEKMKNLSNYHQWEGMKIWLSCLLAWDKNQLKLKILKNSVTMQTRLMSRRKNFHQSLKTCS